MTLTLTACRGNAGTQCHPSVSLSPRGSCLLGLGGAVPCPGTPGTLCHVGLSFLSLGGSLSPACSHQWGCDFPGLEQRQSSSHGCAVLAVAVPWLCHSCAGPAAVSCPLSHGFTLFLSSSCSSGCSFPGSGPGSPCRAAQPGPRFPPCGPGCSDPRVFGPPPTPCPSSAGPSYCPPTSSSPVPGCSPRVSRACPGYPSVSRSPGSGCCSCCSAGSSPGESRFSRRGRCPWGSPNPSPHLTCPSSSPHGHGVSPEPGLPTFACGSAARSCCGTGSSRPGSAAVPRQPRGCPAGCCSG